MVVINQLLDKKVESVE